MIYKTNKMFEQAFKNIDDILWKDDGVDAFQDQQQERYKEQLEKYGALLKLQDDNQMRLGLYFPLLQGWREWTPDASSQTMGSSIRYAQYIISLAYYAQADYGR